MAIRSVLMLMVLLSGAFGGDVPSDFYQSFDVHHVPIPEAGASEADDDYDPSKLEVPEGAASLVFVFDTTGSMHDDLVQVTEGAAKILETVLERREKLLHNYVLVPFHDPVVGPVYVTTDHLVFQQHLKDLYVQGGGDCPESSVKAVKMALEVSLPYSFIYVFTDASATDFPLGSDVLRLIQRKQSQVVFVMTGDCGNSSHPGYQIYEQIASTSSGQVFHLNKTDVDEVLNFVRVSLQARKVNLLAIDQVSAKELTVPLVVDHNLKEFTISLSGDNPTIQLVDPTGEPLKEVKGLLNIDNVRVVNIKDPIPGSWTVKLKSDSPFTVRATGLSPVDFVHGFSRQPTPNLLETSYRPLKGTPTFLLVNGTNLTDTAQFESVELVDLTGDTVQQVALSKVPDQPSLFNATPFIPPDNYFYLKVHGHDETGQPIERISTTAISAELPGVPEMTMKPHVDGFYGKSVTLSCHVQSLVPFGVQWYRELNNVSIELSLPAEYPQTNEVLMRFNSLTAEDEGTYLCKASNVAGSSTASSFLEVKEPVPTIEELKDPVAVPGQNLNVTCVARSTGQFNITWSRYNYNEKSRFRFSTALLRSELRFKDWKNGSFVITKVESGDQGLYRCTAKNEGGSTHRKIYITVQEGPKVSVDHTEMTFVEDGNITVNCHASGAPNPTVEWFFGGIPVKNGSHSEVTNGTMKLFQVQRGQEGVYECVAENSAGTSNASVTLKYIEAPRVVPVTPKLLVNIGDKSELKCNSTGIPKPSIKWFRGDIEVHSDSFLAISQDGSLTILGTQEVDAGEYTCVAINIAGTAHALLTLDVGSSPAILQPPADTSVDIEGEGTLLCVALGLPDPVVSWRRKDGKGLDGKRFTQGPQGSLTITEILMEEEGIFVCTAENKFGKTEAEALVKVIGIEPPRLQSQPNTVESKLDLMVTLRCKVRSGRPWPLTAWYRDGLRIIDEDGVWEDDDGTLVFDEVQEVHEGLYACVASNVGGNDTQVTTLLVHVAPEISDGETSETVTAREGSDIALPCPSSGDPKPIVTWKKQGSPEKVFHGNPDDSLPLNSVAESDSGVYECEARNAAGSKTKKVTLVVEVMPRILKDANATVIRKGDVAVLNCKNHAVPVAKVTWVLGSGEVVDVGDPRFTLLSNGGLKFQALEEDSGSFRCEAANVVGTDRHSVQVLVVVPPTVFPATDDHLTLVSGQEMFMLCLAKGVPEPSLQWYHEQDSILGSSDIILDEIGGITISAVTPQHAGMYQCVANNSMGRAEHKFFLKVHDPPRVMSSSEGNVTVLEGEEVNLPCEASGDPTPKVAWTKDGVEVSGHVAAVSREHSGTYICTVSNVAGNDSTAVDLQVHVAPSIMEDVLESNLEVVSGRSLSVECPVDAVPTPVMTWMKDRVPLNLSSRVKVEDNGKKLEVFDVGVEDAGNYTCYAENVAGDTWTEFNVEVLVAPKFVADSYNPKAAIVEEGPLTLDCSVTGNPLPTVTWRRDEKPMSSISSAVSTIWKQDGHRLYLDRARVHHSGSYKCVASSRVGHIHRDFQVEVHVVPRIDGKESESLEILAGERVQLSCPATGIPRPVIEWMVNDRPLSVGEDGGFQVFSDGVFLLILNSDVNRAGKYKCVATNVVGQAAKMFDLKVLVPPSIKDAHTVQVVKINRGEDLQLYCEATGDPKPKVYWYRNGVTVLDGNDETLRIEDIEPTSAGSFRCSATSNAGMAEKDFQVQVIVPPTVTATRHDPRLEVLLDVPLTLKCPVTGDPYPTITWFKDGNILGNLDLDGNVVLSSDKKELRLVKAREADVGRYECEAVNEAGQTRIEHFVDVLVAPEMLDKDHNDTNIVAREGDTVTLRCPVKKGHPQPTITWLRDGRIQDMKNIEGKDLVLSDVSEYDAGGYVCVATNIAGTADRMFQIDVHVAPKEDGPGNVTDRPTVVVMNRPVSLDCEVSGHPTPRIIWMKDGKQLDVENDPNMVVSSDGKKLKLLRTRVKDAATFTCVASNSVGETRIHFQVDVQVSPHIDRTSLSPKLRANAGNPVSLRCPVTGNPAPTVMWLKDGHPVASEYEDGTLRINSTDEGHAGKYTCLASNNAGVDEFDVKLEISVAPKFEENEDGHEDLVILANRPVTLVCPVTGTPQPVVKWLKDGEPISRLGDPNLSVLPSDPRRLRMRRIKSKDSGRYSCVAVNEAGQIRKEFDISISVPPRIKESENNEIYDGNLRVAEGSSAQFVCEATGSPTPSIIWLKEGHLLSTDPTGPNFSQEFHVMTFEKANRDHAGRYTCVATNAAGNDERDFTLEIMAPPKSTVQRATDTELKVRLNRPVVIKCPLESDPKPTYSWIKDGKELAVTGDRWVRAMDEGRKLHVVRARIEDNGRWTCIAENDAGKAHVDIEVQVQVPPTVTTTKDDHVVKVGDPLRLDCKVTGNPRPIVEWLKDGDIVETDLLDDGDRVLTVDEVNSQTAGKFLCLATNEVGTAKQEFTVDVIAPPEIGISEETVDTVVLVNRPLSLECPVTSSGPTDPVVYWTREGVEVGADRYRTLSANGQRLQLVRTRQDDGGHYECVAMNEAGESKRTFRVIVWVPPKIEGDLSDDSGLPNRILERYNADFECYTTGNPPPNITWFKDDLLLSNELDSRMQLLSDDQHLRIDSVLKMDEGRYTCVASNIAGRAQRDYQLLVDVPASVRPFRENPRTIIVNRPVAIECNITGDPSPTVSWFIDDLPVDPFHDSNLQLLDGGKVLQLRRARLVDSGKYACVAVNSVGKDEATLHVEVLSPPVIDRSHWPSGPVLTVEGKPTELECLVSAGHPVPSVLWEKDGDSLTTSKQRNLRITSDGMKLRLDRTTRTDSGTYTCLATNAVGTDEVSAKLNVIEPPKIPAEQVQVALQVLNGEPVTLRCPAKGQPAPTVTWSKDEKPLDVEGMELRLARVRERDAGRYTCLAVNVAGEAQAFTDLEVHVPPSINGQRPAGPLRVLDRHGVTLECGVSGTPTPLVTWLKDAGPLDPKHSVEYDTVRLRNVSFADGGLYTCVAVNEAGAEERSFHVDIMVPPEVLRSQMQSSVTVIVGDDATLSCPYTGLPTPKVLWRKDSRSIAPNGRFLLSEDRSRLVVAGVHPTDEGPYECVVVNEAGEDSVDILLVVQVPPHFAEKSADTREKVKVLVDEELVLECLVSGSPRPVVTWYKDDHVQQGPRVKMGSDGRRLEIQFAALEDDGVHVCVADNGAGILEKQFVVDVQVAPGIDPTKVRQTVHSKVDEKLTIECPATGDPLPMVTWMRNGHPAETSERVQLLNDGYTLSISPTSLSDEGQVTCVATSDAGTIDHTFNILIHEPPWMVKEAGARPEELMIIVNRPLKLECPSGGNPPPKVSWTKDGHPVNGTSADGSTLEIVRAASSHAGWYECQATNDAGMALRRFKVEVLVPSRIVDARNEVLSVVSNWSIDLNCQAEGFPRPKVHWSKDLQPIGEWSRVLVSQDGFILHVPHASKDHIGLYSCFVSNAVGNVSKDFSLGVIEPPMINNTVHRVTARINEATTLPCDTQGLPRPRILWFKGHERLPLGPGGPGGELFIPEAKVTDSGSYECVAVNEAGEDSKRMVLEVQVPPSMREALTDVVVLEGDSVYLSCVVHGVPTPTVTWRRGSTVIRPQEGITVGEDGTLHIEEVKVLDAGLYGCWAQNPVGFAFAERRLTVHVPASIDTTDSEYRVLKGHDALLMCKVFGAPPPQVTWSHNGVPLPSPLPARHRTLREGLLQIATVQPEDAGRFRCTAENAVGTAFKDLTLVVLVAPNIDPALPSELTVIRGGSVHLPCHATGFPPALVSWTKSDDALTWRRRRRRSSTNGPGDVLVIEGVEREDAGYYVCVAVNDAGRVAHQVRLVVHVAPTITVVPEDQIVTVGSDVQLTCEAQGNPVPNIEWLHDGLSVFGQPWSSGGKGYLQLDMVTNIDSGFYSCLATNEAGAKLINATLTVNVPPVIMEEPGNIEVTLLDTLTLSCVADGHPWPKVTWTRHGQKLAESTKVHYDGEDLIIGPVQEGDEGPYKCIVSNVAGTAEGLATVTVNTPPTIRIPPMSTVVELGEVATMDCSAQGRPTPLVDWFKDALPVLEVQDDRLHILPNGSLRIVAVQANDEGYYTCVARNHLAAIEAQALLGVRVHGQWSSWGLWSECGVSCGHGTQTRSRRCDNPEPTGGGKACAGLDTESKPCERALCPVDGGWGVWQEWSECSATCGTGTRMRGRSCDNPLPQAGGRLCVGPFVTTEQCTRAECPVDGNWGIWGPWSDCSATCGEGTSSRLRFCDSPKPSSGGAECSGPNTEKRPCQSTKCQVDGQWGEWDLWSQCSLSCGGGVRHRQRFCDSPAPSDSGKPCSGPNTQSDFCSNDPCPVHGQWSAWAAWGECSVNCGGGHRRRFRSCDNPAPGNGGRNCMGPSQDTQDCNVHPCAQDGQWAPWSPWSLCSATCGSGTRQRFRTCTDPPPMAGGKRCAGDGSQVEMCPLESCEEVPISSVGHLIGSINGEDLRLSAIAANVTTLGNERTMMATISNVPLNTAGKLSVLVSLLSPIYWTTAFEVGQALNGFSLTKGYFRRETQVSFTTGEVLKMTHVARGVDRAGNLLIDAVVSGDVPSIDVHDDVAIDKYTEDYVQTGPGSLHAFSTRTFRVSNYTLPYAWNHTVSYDETLPNMPYLVQKLHASNVAVHYEPSKQELRYTVMAAISKGTPSNQCPSGLILDSEGQYCKDDDECARLDPCSHGCVNTIGSFECGCPIGYTLGPDGRNCQDLDECRLGLNECPLESDCENTLGSYRCLTICKPGYRRSPSGTSCIDIDECAEHNGNCEQQCVNTMGDFNCGCVIGYRLVGRSRCYDVDECQLSDHSCSHGCENTEGSYRCTCPSGYAIGTDNTCQDVNECETAPWSLCGLGRECRNTPGSYECFDPCPAGFRSHVNGSCVDVDECRQEISVCHFDQSCENTHGGYRCVCPAGYLSAGMGLPCQDVDECQREPNPCQFRCVNLLGDYECQCPPGQKRLADRKSCAGLVYVTDEIKRSSLRPCPNGFQRVDGTCQDYDECETEGRCQYQCKNSVGSYQCLCPKGYRLASNERSCVDIDECHEEEVECGADRMCFNLRGSYECVDTPCPSNFERDATTGYCKLSCDRTDAPCPPGVRYAQLLAFRTVALPSGIKAFEDLVRLAAFDQNGRHLPNTVFQIVENELGAPFRMRAEQGKGVVYTVRALDPGKRYKMTVQAISFDQTRTIVQYTTKFVVYVAVAMHPY